MADDPNRDILPVKDESFCGETCRSNIDLRERHFIYKLDRYELEDKYLRLLEEANHLKKISNCQEDKIKRLATKLMRVTANPRTCTVALDIFDDKKKIIGLELENAKLKDKIVVLRNQLLSHTMVSRSSSRSRNPQPRPSSGRITYRSESSRSKLQSCQCIGRDGSVDTQRSNKIEELEAQRKEMAFRISQLEKELSASVVTNQREKNAENVEYIKVWRQMKQLNDKLIAAQSTNDSLNLQINDLEKKLEEAVKNNKDMSAALLTEQKRALDVDEQMLKMKDSQLCVREKDEQIQDLANEVKILQQHNSELVALSCKYCDVEQENLQLKKKINEQQYDQEALQCVMSTEQANIVALQNSNDHLLEKLQELQKNIGSLTTLQTQTENNDPSKATQMSTKKSEKNILIDDAKCKDCCSEHNNVLDMEEITIIPTGNNVSKDNFVQTEYAVQQCNRVTKDQGTTVMTPTKEVPKKVDTVCQENREEAISETPLTPKKMLTLLDQAQINTHSNKSPRIVDCKDYNSILRHRQVVSLEKLLFGDSSL